MRWKILHDEFFENFNSFVRIVNLKFLYDDAMKNFFRLTDLTLWPIPIMSLCCFLISVTNSFGVSPWSNALLNIFAAPSNAPPKRSPWKTLFISHKDQFNILDYIKSILCNLRGWWKFRLRHMVMYIFKIHFFPIPSLHKLNQTLDFYVITSPRVYLGRS